MSKVDTPNAEGPHDSAIDSRSDKTAQAGVTQSQNRIPVSVIIPTYNEKQNISSVIFECLKALPPGAFDTEIIVVDDDSDDYTWQYPPRLFGHDPRVRVIRRQAENAGLARSVVNGFEAATNEYCAVIDADLQHPPEKLGELFGALDEGADVAIGSRHIDGGGIENWSTSRKIVSKGATFCARGALASVRDISDPMSGFFAIRRRVLDGVELNPQGYKILLEILGKGHYETVTEVPYVFQERERGESKLTADEYVKFLEHLGQLAVDSRDLDSVIGAERAVRGAEFAFIGAVGTLVNMLVFSLLVTADIFYLAAGTVAFLAAVNWNFAGNWFLTYDQPAGNLWEQYVLFHTVSVVGFIAYSATLAVTAFIGVPLLLANLIAIISGSGVNFFGSEKSVFNRNTGTDTSTESVSSAAVGLMAQIDD